VVLRPPQTTYGTKAMVVSYDGTYGYNSYDGTKGYDGYDGTTDMTAMMVWRLQWRNHIHGMSESTGRLTMWKLWEIMEWHESTAWRQETDGNSLMEMNCMNVKHKKQETKSRK